MADCTDAIPLENLDYCPNTELAPGVSEVGVYVAAVADFDTIEKPADLTAGTDLENIATIDAAHVFKLDRGFFKVYINPDSGLVETAHGGEKGSISFNNSFTGTLQGTGAKTAGFLRKYKNMPLIIMVKERSGNTKQIGSELSPAYLIEVTGTSGQAAGDSKNTIVKFQDTQNYPAPEYAGTIQEFPAPDPQT
ncbi:hypothetical protein [Mesonia mobilis]|uniref:hypothetical protein n=1 Tax=Mesonia mobilis TaxID=369791 RepID=UPI0024B9D282|nr:hypothetical protein [Mesonia mobilis]